MSQSDRGPVVIDTGVFSARLGHRDGRLTAEYRPILEGRPAIISFVTAAEIQFGATVAGWGPSRLQRLDRELHRAEIVWPGPELVDAYAALRAWCVRNGHGLGQKDHEADRWIAATAIRLGVPLGAHDAIFRDVEGLTFISKL